MAIIAITGATGFIGRHVLRRLASNHNYELVAGIRTSSRKSENWAEFSRLRVVELSGEESLAQFVAGANAVVHLAGLASSPGGAHANNALQLANVELTARLVDVALRHRVQKFIHLSSIRAVVGSSSDQIVDDTKQPAPSEPYGRSKLASERELARFAEAGNFGVSLRPPLVIGADAKGNWRQLQEFAAKPLPLPLAGIGNRRSYLPVDGLCAAIEHLLQTHWSPDLSGAYCLAHPEAISASDVLAALRRGMGHSRKLFHFPGLSLARHMPVLAAPAASLLGSLEVNPKRFLQTFEFQFSRSLSETITQYGQDFARRRT